MLAINGYAMTDVDYCAPPYQMAEPGQWYAPSSVPPGWGCVDHDIWTAWEPLRSILPDQGWKLHISVRLERADAVLEEMARLCFEQGVAFKHVSEELFFPISKMSSDVRGAR